MVQRYYIILETHKILKKMCIFLLKFCVFRFKIIVLYAKSLIWAYYQFLAQPYKTIDALRRLFEPTEQREPSCSHVWPSRDGGRWSQRSES